MHQGQADSLASDVHLQDEPQQEELPMKDPTLVDTQPLKVFPRRTFLRSSVMGAAGTAASLSIDPAHALATGMRPERVKAWLAQAATATPEAMAAYSPTALSADEFAVVKAAVGRIIPTDDLGPGADEAGVHIFIDQALSGPDAATLPLYQQGVVALDQLAGGNGFAAAAAGEQDAALSALESSGSEGTPEATPVGGANPGEANAVVIPAGFLAMLIEHTRQGMFGDPIYGGNASFVGWDLIGYPGMKLAWAPEEQEVGAVVAPEHISVEQYGGTGHE